MFQRLYVSMTLAALAGCVLPAQPVGQNAYIQEVNPFTHVAYIPAGADMGAIRFEKVKLTQVPTRIRHGNAADCNQPSASEPGGSFACDYSKTEASAPAYELTYSVTAQPLASDEFSGRNFTFRVYFRPDEMAPEALRALTAGRLKRADAAAYFAVSTTSQTVKQVAINANQSRFCEGAYLDGSWVHRDAGCQDAVSYSAVNAPSGYSVKVASIAGRAATAAVAARK